MYIPELKYTFYAPIVLASIMLGMAAAAILMRRAGVKKQTVLYTSLLTFVSIIIVSFATSVVLSGDIRRIGFVGAGGALGLLIGAVASALIHGDHVSESLSAWVVSAPLMYGLSKIACHITGCCKGVPHSGTFRVIYERYDGQSFFPVQLTETISFLAIFIIGLILYAKMKNKLNAAIITLVLSGVFKIGLEFLRDSHLGKVVTGYQILVLAITCVGAIALLCVGNKGTDAW